MATKKTYPITSDQIDVGTNQGQVPVLGAGGALPSAIPVDSASVTYNNAGKNFNSTNIQSLGDEISDAYTASKEITGIVDNTQSTLTFTEATRTVTITPVATSFDYYIWGKKYTVSSAKTVVISNTTGMHFIYIGNDLNLHETTVFDVSLMTSHGYVCSLYWNATTGKGIYVADERHGITMDGATHMHFHQTIGTQFISGFALSNFSIDGTGNLAADAQFGCDNGSIRDEDLQHDIVSGSPQILNTLAEIPIMWRSGTNGDWNIKTSSTYPLIYSGDGSGYVGASGRPPFNEWTGTTWQLTELVSGDYFLVHYFATNDLYSPVKGIQGNSSYTNVTLARAGANDEIGTLTGLPFQEFVPIGTVIFQTVTTYTNVPKARIISTDIGNNYVDWRSTSTFNSFGITSDHGNLSGLSDDDHIHYHTDARGDARYFPYTGVLSGGTLSIGAGTGSPLTYTTISVTAGTGIIVDSYTNPSSPVYTLVTWPAYTNVAVTGISAYDRTFVAIDSTGTLIQQTTEWTPADRRNYITIGTVGHFGTQIEAVRSDLNAVFDVGPRLVELARALGQLNVTGNVYGPNGANMLLNKSAGSSYKIGSNFSTSRSSPDTTTDPVGTGITFKYSYRDGVGGYTETANTTTAIGGSYDNGTGTLATVSTNSWTAQILTYFAGADEHRIEYGQAVYASKTDALAAIPYVTFEHNTSYDEGIIRGYMIIRGGATNLSLTSDAVFIEANKFSGGGSVPPPTGHAYDLQTATASQTVFNLPFTFSASATNRTYITIYVNRTKQIEGGSPYDYTITGTSQITFGTPMVGGEIVEFYGL